MVADLGARDIRIDFLRVIAAIAVVLLHSAANTFHFLGDTIDSAWWMTNVYGSLSRWCVPVFIMISGAILLEKPIQQYEIKYSFIRRFSKLLPALIFWSVAFILFRYLVLQQPWSEIYADTLVGLPFYHLWFFYMLCTVYLLMPVINFVVHRVKPRWLMLYCAIVLLLSFSRKYVEFVTGFKVHIYYVDFHLFVIMGYLIWHKLSEFTYRYAIFWTVFMGGSICLTAYYLFSKMGKIGLNIAYSNFNPLVAMMAALLFALIRVRNIGRLMKYLASYAPLSVGVYAVHPFFLWFVEGYGLSGIWLHPAVGIPMTTLCVIVLSMGFTAAITCIPSLRKIVMA